MKPLMHELAVADERHPEHRSATFLVRDELHDELTSELPVDTAEWWGQRTAVEAAVPDGVVQSALAAFAR